MPNIPIKCTGSRWAALDSLTVIQGELKELSQENYAKLRHRIETKGFDAPLFVWKNKILDGTQRYRVLGVMVQDGWTLPKGVPVCDIQAKSLSEAKERLLGYVSQYGKLTEDGLSAFLEGMQEPDLSTLDLPDFDLMAFLGQDLEDEAPEAAAANNEQHEGLRPLKKVHVLLSFTPEVLPQIEEHLDRILLHPEVEYEQSANG